MRNRRIDNLLEGFLSLDLLIEYPKSYVFEVNNESIFTIILDLFLEDTEHELLFILLLVGRKVNVGIMPRFSVVCTLKKLFFDKLLIVLKSLEEILVWKV
jgi:hypothetical protein